MTYCFGLRLQWRGKFADFWSACNAKTVVCRLAGSNIFNALNCFVFISHTICRLFWFMTFSIMAIIRKQWRRTLYLYTHCYQDQIVIDNSDIIISIRKASVGLTTSNDEEDACVILPHINCHICCTSALMSTFNVCLQSLFIDKYFFTVNPLLMMTKMLTSWQQLHDPAC